MIEESVEKELTEKQKIFCNEYIFDFNATRSYRVAYPDASSDNVAAAAACRLLRNVNIQAYIDELQKDLQKVSGISKLKVLKEFEAIGFSNISNMFTDWTKLSDYNNLPEKEKKAILEITYKKDKTGDADIETEFVKIKLHDKQKALENICKMLGFNENESKEEVKFPELKIEVSTPEMSETMKKAIELINSKKE